MANERKIGVAEIDRLYDFLDGLQASGYVIDPRQYLALSDLLMALIADGNSLNDLPLKTLIAPLICTNPVEQQDFYQRFDRWYTALLPVKQASLSGEGTVIPSPLKRRWSLPTINRTVVIWVTIVISTIALIVWLISDAAVTGAQVINNTVSLYGALFVGFCFIVWFVWQVSILYQENQYITRELANQEPVYTKLQVKAYVQDLIPIMQLKPIVSTFRKRMQIASAEVDVDKTIENALNRNNWLEIFYRQRQVIPEYVVLIDRKSQLDQQARFVQEILAKLALDGVWLHQYEFSSDPRICFPLDRKDTPLRLKDLQARHPDSRLLIFSGANELINPLTGLLQEWLESLSHWQERAVFTPDKLQKALREKLETQDFVILPMTFDGLASLVHVFETDNSPIQTNGVAGLPARLIERPLRWIGRDAPPEDEVKTLVEDLKNNYLDENGFYWLCATAVYPELRWELTIYLGSVLKGDAENSLLTPDNLVRLARLPWFRFGYMPDWIRIALVKNFTQEQENQVRIILSKMLTESFDLNGFELKFGKSQKESIQTRFISAFFRNLQPENVYDDYIFTKFILNRNNQRLSVKLPKALRRFIQNRVIIFNEFGEKIGILWKSILKATSSRSQQSSTNKMNFNQANLDSRTQGEDIADSMVIVRDSNTVNQALIQKFFNIFKSDTVTLEKRNRRILLNHVENAWIKGVLEKTLHDKQLLEIGIKNESANETFPTGTSMLEIFDSIGMGRSLLILGAPGSGKTTMLLELARGLIARAREDITQPIPTVFNLASWTENLTLADWLSQELNSLYSVPRKTAPEWVKGNKLVLLLDGLDEVQQRSRVKCIEAINEFRKQHGLTSLVVCSRSQDYAGVDTKLSFEVTVQIQLLMPEQIMDFAQREDIEKENSEAKEKNIRKTNKELSLHPENFQHYDPLPHETEITVWGPTQSGKDWLLRGFAKELEEYTLRSSDFIFDLRESNRIDSNYLPVLPFPPDDIYPTATGEDYIHTFTRRIKTGNNANNLKISSFTHHINFHNNGGADLVASLLDPEKFEVTFLSIIRSQNLLIILDPNIEKNENIADAEIFDINRNSNRYPEIALMPGMSKDNYFKILTMLLEALANYNSPKKNLAICITKTDTLKIRGNAWNLIERTFGQKVYRLFDNYRRVFNIEAFSTSAAGYILRKGRSVPNYSNGKLIEPDLWRPINCATPFFWLFQNIEIERIKATSNFLFREDNLRKYIRYPLSLRE